MLTSLGSLPMTPQWSPDGEWIGFHASHLDANAIYRIRATGGTPQLLTAGGHSDSNPSWSADGKWIYFDSNRSGSKQIWKMPSDGGEAVQVTHVGGGIPRASPDGQFVYFNRESSARAIGGEGWISEIWRIPVQGGKEEKILDAVWTAGFAVVREGIYFTQVPGADGRFVIKFYDLATGKIRSVAESDGSPDVILSVSPDHRSFLYSNYEGSSELMLVENFH